MKERYNNFVSTEDATNPGLKGVRQRGWVNCGMSLCSTNALEFLNCKSQQKGNKNVVLPHKKLTSRTIIRMC